MRMPDNSHLCSHQVFSSSQPSMCELSWMFIGKNLDKSDFVQDLRYCQFLHLEHFERVMRLSSEFLSIGRPMPGCLRRRNQSFHQQHHLLWRRQLQQRRRMLLPLCSLNWFWMFQSPSCEQSILQSGQVLQHQIPLRRKSRQRKCRDFRVRSQSDRLWLGRGRFQVLLRKFNSSRDGHWHLWYNYRITQDQSRLLRVDWGAKPYVKNNAGPVQNVGTIREFQF